MLGAKGVPPLVRHSVLAIYKKIGGGADGFIRAFKISRDTLAKSGYLFARDGNDIVANIHLTGKGFVRNSKHLMEGFEGSAKDLEFEKMFKMLEPRLYELDGPGGKKAKTTGESATEEKVKIAGSEAPSPLPDYPIKANK
jgi:hypothetical protein